MTQFIDDFSNEIWQQTYKDHHDHDIDSTFLRVAKAIASVESTEELRTKWTEKFFDMLTDFKCTSGGRIYANAGTQWGGTTLLNCFVSPEVKDNPDSINGIIENLRNQALTLKSEGGWGFNFGILRPRGAFIKGIGVESPGSVKFMELFDKSSEIVTAGSGKKNTKGKGKIRKGAMMGVLPIWHPDIIEFITAKQQPGRLSKFNISVDCTDEFMNKVMCDESEDDSWNLIFPDTEFEHYESEWNGNINQWRQKGYPVIVYNTVSAKWLWNLIMESTYNRAEPGVLFLDRANDYNPANYLETIYATNPCFKGDTVIATADGRNGVTIKQLSEESKGVHRFPVYSADENFNVEIKNAIAFRTGCKEIIKVVLSDGSSFECTPDHRIASVTGEWIEAKDSIGVTLVSMGSDVQLSVTGVVYSGEFTDVYDLTVDDNHNFFIYSDNHKSILVHNCGEQTLAPAGVCCLGSINLTQYVTDDRKFDFEKFMKYIPYMVRFLDNVNEYSSAPLPEYLDSMKNKRRIGVGVLGWGSLLFMLKIRFGSEQANELRDQIMSVLAKTAYESSIDLALEKGMFTYCNPEEHANGKFVNSLGLSEEYMTKLRTTGIRNSSLLSIQPTGTTSIFANIVSGGLEPIFLPEYIRTSIVPVIPDEIVDQTPKFFEGEWKETDLFKFTKEGDEEILRAEYNGVVYKIDKSRGLTRETTCKDYGVRFLEQHGEWDPTADWAVTALSGLTAEDHLNDLKGFARYIDSAISKTVNVPNDYKFEDFKNIYIDAYKSGYIKGVTTYRSGTMAAVLSAKETDNNGYDEEVILDTVKMPDSNEATMKVLKAEGRKWYMTVVWNETKTRPFALFVHTNHHEKSVTTHDAVDRLITLAEEKGIPTIHIDGVREKIAGDNNASKITRVLSLLLRHGVAIKNIVNTLSKVDNVFVGSFIYQITKYLSSFIKDGEKIEGEKCTECGAEAIVYQEGCKICKSCGNSKC